jgi:hypothetical protein
LNETEPNITLLMRNKHYILNLVLALMLLGSNMAFSDHFSNHAITDFGSCSLCFHQGGSGNAITPQVCTLVASPATFNSRSGNVSSPYLQIDLHDHQSRAPPGLT